jgi:hypothetical protein
LEAGMAVVEIARLGYPAKPRQRYDWAAIQAY